MESEWVFVTKVFQALQYSSGIKDKEMLGNFRSNIPLLGNTQTVSRLCYLRWISSCLFTADWITFECESGVNDYMVYNEHQRLTEEFLAWSVAHKLYHWHSFPACLFICDFFCVCVFFDRNGLRKGKSCLTRPKVLVELFEDNIDLTEETKGAMNQ